MKKKILSLSVIAIVMTVGILVVSAASATGIINVDSKTVHTVTYTASKANLLSTITSLGYGAGTPGTYIRVYLKNGNSYVQKLGFKQDIGAAGHVTVQNGYVGIGNWKLTLYGKNPETGLSYADWSGMWTYGDQ